jgi:heptosyltransferase-2
MAKNILVRAPNWLGDAVMCTPFLRRLAASRPGDRVHVLCRPAQKEVFEGLPGLDGVLTFRQGEGAWALAGRLRRERYDEGYVLPPSFSSALLFALAGVPERIGHPTDWRGPLLTRRVPLDERWHYVRRYLSLLGDEGAEVGPADFHFPSATVITDKASFFLAKAALPPLRAPCLAVAPGSQAPARRWFPERFAELVDSLPEKDWPTVLLLGAPSDVVHAKEVEDLCRRPVVNLCGRTNLLVLGDLLKRCAALVTNESGLMHVAWAVGTPTVVVAGPSDTRLTSPFGARARVLQRREVPCVPCVKNECYRPADGYKECLKRIGVDEVREALGEMRKAVES